MDLPGWVGSSFWWIGCRVWYGLMRWWLVGCCRICCIGGSIHIGMLRDIVWYFWISESSSKLTEKAHAPQWYVSMWPPKKTCNFDSEIVWDWDGSGGQVPRPGWRFLRAWTFWRRVLLTRRSPVARRFFTLHRPSTWRAVQRIGERGWGRVGDSRWGRKM